MPRGDGPAQLAQARDALERGKTKAAVRHAWSAAQGAGTDTRLLGDVERLAIAIEERADGKSAKEAHMLARYCAELVTQLEAGVKPPGLLGGLFSRGAQRTKTCPDCAEQIKRDAKVCRYCGYRYPDA